MNAYQIRSLEKYRVKYENNCKEFADWNSNGVCSFDVYESPNEDDPNIVLVMTTIDKIDDTMAGVHTDVQKIMITPEGTCLELSNSFSDDEVIKYIESLKKYRNGRIIERTRCKCRKTKQITKRSF